ncbi:MAG: DUF6442 family protein [Eubacteriales bacterium]|nr:DUF6442 family protein [Eubacteriales bacterium]
MKKEEILAKSRAEKRDEGEEYVAGKGRYYGVKAMAVMFLALFLFNLAQGQRNDIIFAMWWTYIGFEALGKYRIGSRNKLYLITAVCGILAGVLYAIDYILYVLK